jgi:HME family heavy-metal exporter/cobalt-zinc-cadmium resistance protein CzcA
MTACITALGMVPLLLATGPGSEIQRPLAVVVAGGLISSTALTCCCYHCCLSAGVARSARSTKMKAANAFCNRAHGNSKSYFRVCL